MASVNKFSENDITAMQHLEKPALYATVNPDGLPHITFANSLMAASPIKLTLGQFVKGESKWFMQQNPKIGFFILSPQQKRLWFGKALWTAKQDEGPELDAYKAMPMQRYNSYFPIHRVHYFDLVKTTPPQKLPLLRIFKSVLLTRFAKGKAVTHIQDRILNHYSESLFNKMAAMAFISYVGTDGFPVLIPVFEIQASDSRRLVFNPGPFKKELEALLKNTDVAVFALSLKLESVLIRGVFTGFRSYRGIKLGIININWVYNSMPPNAGQIYPEVALGPVTMF